MLAVVEKSGKPLFFPAETQSRPSGGHMDKCVLASCFLVLKLNEFDMMEKNQLFSVYLTAGQEEDAKVSISSISDLLPFSR